MSLKVSRILHAGYVFEHGGARIVFDPVFENPFSGNCHAFPSVRFDLEQIRDLRFSAVFISHFHDDHCSLESLDHLHRETPIYVYCLHDELFELIRDLGFVDVRHLELDIAVRVGEFEIIPRRALDADVDSMFQVRLGDLNVLNVVDSMMDPETLAMLKEESWDLVLWPFQTMREIAVIAPSRCATSEVEIPVEWIEELQALNPRYVVPSSCQFLQEPWSWYNQALFPISYQQFEQTIRAALPQIQVIRMNPSASVLLGKNSLELSAALPWVQPLGEQNVDYVFRPDLTPPSTGEIAMRFQPLSTDETERTLGYCRAELPRVYGVLEATPFFDRPRIWRLSVFDHEGVKTDFIYKIIQNSMELVAEAKEQVGWATEVPLCKLHAALERGETLTSMYVRVNHIVFTPEIESDLLEADVLEDPLIRSLFNGKFGSYQREQLKRIKERSKISCLGSSS